MFACVYVLESENAFLGGSPGLVVMGGNSCSKGREFKSQHHIQDGHFYIPISGKICNGCLKRRK